jgi:hypothetical protein
MLDYVEWLATQCMEFFIVCVIQSFQKMQDELKTLTRHTTTLNVSLEGLCQGYNYWISNAVSRQTPQINNYQMQD